MRKSKKLIFIFILILLGIILALYLFIRAESEKLPEMNSSPAADQIADSMMMVLGKEGWDTLHFLQWVFKNKHQYLWNKPVNSVLIEWGGNRVMMNLDNQTGRAWKRSSEVGGREKENLMKKAWKMWCNDSFWMFAPFKAKDPGTTRTLVEVPAPGVFGLLVTYQSGGVTPGDHYLWILDHKYVPLGFKMWVSIIPIEGLYVSWDRWLTLDEGIKLSTFHESKFFTSYISDVKSGVHYADFGYENDPFSL
ncbi:MAG TPA: hypothetical protein PKC30_13885 [Saprospiraceae bacterium]|nr:hypothetical protein [Saprospiraceae bacterium]